MGFIYYIVALIQQINLILSEPVFDFTPQCCVLSGEATNTNLIVYDLRITWDITHNVPHLRHTR